jgi:patatin-like phospholipase/acyl hydrolase
VITTCTNPGGDDSEERLPLSAQRVLNFYKDNAAKIFPRDRITTAKKKASCFRPKYNPEGLYDLLNEYCGDQKLSDALTNVIIPSFDINFQQPDFFSSWKTRFKDVLVKDVCRATTAAPTFLPPVCFEPQTPPGNNRPQFNMIDGGIAANNPVSFSSGGQSGLLSLTFYQCESFLKTYLSIDYHNLGCPAWS